MAVSLFFTYMPYSKLQKPCYSEDKYTTMSDLHIDSMRSKYALAPNRRNSQYHAQLGLPDIVCKLKGLVVCYEVC